MTTIEITETLQDGVLKAIETGQRLTLEALGAGVSSLDGLLPSSALTPLGTPLVSPGEFIDSGFRFAESLLASQKSFLSELVLLAEPKKVSTK